ncbi:MAG: GNAT family N-acetyltransferase [Candidatus Zixiibacteriota bacterium]|nr:MAG: GNAT family N-acetyltransferase [candidate division Zixibacteria bacterium]
MPEATVTLREVTADTVNAILALEVADNQKGFVATNAKSIAQAHFSEHAWFRAIYADEIPVGFVMLHIDTVKHEYFLWRFMIDRNHQKNDYGLRAMEQIIEYVRTLPGAEKIELSFVPGDGDPSGFYAKLGFVMTDRWEGKERIMVLTL